MVANISPAIVRERQINIGEEGVYRRNLTVDELKFHNTPQGLICNIRRGTIEATSNQGKTAIIQCGCGIMVTESI